MRKLTGIADREAIVPARPTRFPLLLCQRLGPLGPLAFIFIVGLAVFAAAPLAAHTELFETAPVADETVGGVVDHIDLLFWTPVAEGEIALIAPDGSLVDVGPTSMSERGRVTSVEFDPLVVAGTYSVAHSETSGDGDLQSASFTFDFDPEAIGRISSLTDRDSGPNWVLLLAIGGAVLVIAGIFAPKRLARR